MGKVLIGCEESQAVCIAFRELGYDAYSCDIQPCSGGHPEWHLQMDVFEAIELIKPELGIFHPPCTFLSNAGIGWFNVEKYGQKAIERSIKREHALQFFLSLYDSNIKRICLENPVGYVNSKFRKPNQTIQPHYFGDNHLKRTCLWLRNLPRLNGTVEAALHPTHNKPEPISIQYRKPSKYYEGGEEKKRYFTDTLSRDAKERSKTFPGIAKAMANSWGKYLTIVLTLFYVYLHNGNI